MLTFLPCYPEHIKLIEHQDGLDEEKKVFLSKTFINLVESEFSLSAWNGSQCVAAAGLLRVFDHRAMAWTFMGKHAGPHMRQITRKVRDVIDSYPAQRIEMLVNCDYEAGHRWAKMLGFEVEAPRMRMSGALGQDEALYSKVKT